MKIDKLRMSFKIPNYYNKGILGMVINAPYQSKRYYLGCLKIFSELEITQIIIFTDNPVLAKEYFPNYPVMNESDNAIDDFLKLCMCEHLIIDRSSYSHLAGILNANPDKIIAQPNNITIT
jgi:hypothetical protein